MRKLHSTLFYTLITLCMVSFSSCSDDDDESNKEFVGMWIESTCAYELDCEPKELKDKILNYFYERIELSTDEVSEFSSDGTTGYYNLLNGKIDGQRNNIGTYKVKGEMVYFLNQYGEEVEKYSLRIKPVNGDLHIIDDQKNYLEEEAKQNYFWENLGVEKPANFKVKKFVETLVLKKFTPTK